jgi:endonuclease/exonuclease/phosphatase (EEP) superfamily protein YafD
VSHAGNSADDSDCRALKADEPPRHGLARRVGLVLIAASLALCAALAAAYALRPDSLAAITVCPAWVWCVPGLAPIVVVALGRTCRRLVVGALLAWAVFLAAFADTPAALVRAAVGGRQRAPQSSASRTPVRVVSLNCGSVGRRAAWDVVGVKPQIVLLQEAPGLADLEALTEKLYGGSGHFVRGADAAIVADGTVALLAHDEPAGNVAVYASVRLNGGQRVNVVSLRLEPAIVRLDFWSPECWRLQTQNRQLRRRQLKGIVARIAQLPSGVPLVLGGDFNAPAGDAIFRELQPPLRDSFREGGVGWGNTIINEAPFARIDQVWIDSHWDAVRVVAQATLRSDHRMVIADLSLRSE